MAHGHDPDRIMDYSPEKIRLIYRMAGNRIRQETASYDLRMIRMIRTSIAATFDKKNGPAVNEFRRVEKELMEVLGINEKKRNDAPQNRIQLIQQLQRKGAKVE